MKSMDVKFLTGQILLTAGLVIISHGGRWPVFIGVAFIAVSGSFSQQRGLKPERLFLCILWPLLMIAIAGIVFLPWCPSFVVEKPPLAALAGVWLGCSACEFALWGKNRSLM